MSSEFSLPWERVAITILRNMRLGGVKACSRSAVSHLSSEFSLPWERVAITILRNMRLGGVKACSRSANPPE